jgi:hypothetical protein
VNILKKITVYCNKENINTRKLVERKQPIVLNNEENEEKIDSKVDNLQYKK